MKKLLSTLAICSILLLNNIAQAQNYTDISQNHWAYNYVKLLSDECVVVGYPDNTFRPDNNITRAEFAAMTIKALKQQDAQLKYSPEFSDVPKEHWAYNAISKAAYFDLVKGTSDGKFLPEETVSRAQVLSIVINSLTTDDMTVSQAREVLSKSYSDYQTIPDWIVVQAGKAECLGIVVKSPSNKALLDADKPASRAEVAAFLSNMIEQVKRAPNKKLAEVMPITSNGIILENTTKCGKVVTIPAGTVLYIKMNECISSQETKTGQLFLSKTPDNYITKEKFLLLNKDDKILGQVIESKKAKLFFRNGKLVIETKTIKTQNNQTADFEALATIEPKFKGFWQILWRRIIKNAKIEVQDGQNICVTLLKPIKVDVTNGWIIQD